jgi:hypothetical protein
MTNTSEEFEDEDYGFGWLTVGVVTEQQAYELEQSNKLPGERLSFEAWLDEQKLKKQWAAAKASGCRQCGNFSIPPGTGYICQSCEKRMRDAAQASSASSEN